jgi:chorismate mutase-like protein
LARPVRIFGLTWGGSSAGRASRSQCEGREFDPPPLHQFTLCLAVALCGSACFAAVPEAGVLRVGSTGDYAPYSWRVNPDSDWLGADVALARKLGIDQGLRTDFVATSWPTLSADFAARKFDVAIGGVSITPERAKLGRFSRAYLTDSKFPVVRCGEEQRFDTLHEINQTDVRVVVNPGGTNERFARVSFPAAQLRVHGDNQTVFSEIVARRADVMVTDGVEAHLQQRAGKGLCAVDVGKRWAPARKAVWLQAQTGLKKAADRSLGRSSRHAYGRELANWEAYPWSALDQPEVQLAMLIDARLVLVSEVARSKWNSQSAIEDPPREKALLASLRQRALPLGISEALVEQFFGAQISAAKLLQEELFARWRAKNVGDHPGVQDLARDLRPQIDQVTTQMLVALQQWSSANRAALPAASTMRLVSPASVLLARAPLTTH